MIIRTDSGEFDTDTLCLVDRVSVDHIIVILEDRTLDLRGLSARQCWAQLQEHQETIQEIGTDRHV